MSQYGGRHAPKHAAKHASSRGPQISPVMILAAVLVLAVIIGSIALLTGRKKKTKEPSANTQTQITETEPAATPEPEGPAALYDKPEYFTISCIGDNTLWASINFEQSNVGLPKMVGTNYAYPYSNTVQYFKDDELTLSNCENNFSDTKLSSMEQFYFCAPNAYAQILLEGGVDFVTTANNHMMDFKQKGADSTYAALDAAGLPYGVEKQAQILTTKSGLKIGIYTQGIDSKPYDSEPEIVEAIGKLREDGAEYVICMFHWGKELYYSPNEQQVKLAHACVDAGADLVYGSHPHCLQPIEEYNGGLILYSVGNWVFGGNTAPTDCDTAIVQVTIERDIYGNLSTSDVDAIPCCVSSRIDAAQAHRDNYNDYCPTPYESGTEAYERVLAKLSGTFEAKKEGADYSNYYASWG